MIARYPIFGPAHRSVKFNSVTMAVGGLLFAHNKILLNRSSNSDLWTIPGGTINFSDSPEDLVKKYMHSELGIKLEVLDAQPFIFQMQVQTGMNIDLIVLMHFVMKTTKKTGEIILGENVADYKWEGIGYHFRDCYPNVKPAIDHFLNI